MKIPRITLLILLALFVGFTACRRDKDDDNKPVVEATPDENGNIYITNQLNEAVYLYQGADLLKEIPADSELFLVNVKNQGLAVLLKVWRKSEVENWESPDEATVFRMWEVVLATGTDEKDRATWVLKESDDPSAASGTVIFDYPETSENGRANIYSVDVFLNSKTGAKIASLAPGTSRKVGIEYNYHVIYYRYWYSDPNGTQGSQEVGWLGDQETISTTINAANPERTLDIPVLDNSSIGRTGKVKITNNSGQDIQIFAGEQPIEAITILGDGGSTQGLSYLNAGESYNYNIPEGAYTLSARNITSGSTIISKDVMIAELYQAKWDVTANPDEQTLTIINQTEERYTLHDASTGDYLGFWVDANSTDEMNFPTDVSSLMAISWGTTITQIYDPIPSELTITDAGADMDVSTGTASLTSTTSAQLGGELINVGTGVSQHGHCWSSTNAMPSISDNKTELGEATQAGTFTSSLSDLDLDKTYYIRAYAMTNNTVVYGQVTTLSTTIPDVALSEDFESYTDFSLDIGNWTNSDFDGKISYGFEPEDYPNEEIVSPFILFNPTATNPPITYFTAHSGNKFVASMSAKENQTNDWLISPAVQLGNNYEVSLWARSINDAYGLDKFRVAVSSGSTKPSDFTIISGTNAVSTTTEWKEYTFSLSAYNLQNVRIAIIGESYDTFMLMIDDVSVRRSGVTTKHSHKTTGDEGWRAKRSN